MRVHRGCPFVRSTRLFSPRINPKTHSETSVLKQVFCIHSGLGLRNAVGNRGLRVRPEPVCRLYTLMRPQFTGLCAHAVRVYVSAVYGVACPYFRKLWLHTSRSCIFVLRGEGFTRLRPAVAERPAALPSRTFQAADIFDAGIEALCQISQVLHDDLVGAERFRAIRHT